jgi:hypothetical protein
MTDTGVGNLDADFVSPWRKDFDLLNAQRLASFPGHCGLALDSLRARSVSTGRDVEVGSVHQWRRGVRETSLERFPYLTNRVRHDAEDKQEVDARDGSRRNMSVEVLGCCLRACVLYVGVGKWKRGSWPVAVRRRGALSLGNDELHSMRVWI